MTLTVSDNLGVDDQVAQLNDRGFVWIRNGFPTLEEALDAARALIDARCAADGLEHLAAIGDFVLPPIDGQPRRGFQTLHFDFGLPLDPKLDQDVARYTALHIPSDVGSVSAVTRLVPLARLLSQRTWPPFVELLGGLIAYGRTHGAWDDARGYVEGSLARVVEGAAAAHHVFRVSRPILVFSVARSSTVSAPKSRSSSSMASTSGTSKSSWTCSPATCSCSTTLLLRTAVAVRVDPVSCARGSTVT